MSPLLTFLLAAVALTGSPGPNTLSMAAVGASFGRASGVEYMLGLNLGVAIVIAIVGSGTAAVLLAVPGVAPVVAVAAALYFLYLAYRIATAPPLRAAASSVRPPRWYEGAGLSLVNPKAYAAMAALFSSHVLVADSAVADTLWKALLLVGVICVVNLAWLLLGVALRRLMLDPSTARVVNVAFALLLVVSVVLTLVA